MGIVRAASNSIKSILADSWLEVIEPVDISNQTLFARGSKVTKGGQNKGSAEVITDGSTVRVNENMIMLLVDGGKIVDYSAEAGYYTVKNDLSPSLLNGSLDETISRTYEQFKYAGINSQKQEVFYINLIELGIKFGTTTPIQYYDSFYNAEMFLRVFGTYSIRVSDPILFYKNVVPKSIDRYMAADFCEQYQQEFMAALGSAINQYSAQGESVSFLSSKNMELSALMKDLLSAQWKGLRGIDIVSVAVANFTYDDKSQKIIDSRNKGASLGGTVKAIFGNTHGKRAIQQAKENAKLDKILGKNKAKWTCQKCKTKNTGKFCSNCGEKAPSASDRIYKPCASCGANVDITDSTPKFCPECGTPFSDK